MNLTQLLLISAGGLLIIGAVLYRQAILALVVEPKRSVLSWGRVWGCVFLSAVVAGMTVPPTPFWQMSAGASAAVISLGLGLISYNLFKRSVAAGLWARIVGRKGDDTPDVPADDPDDSAP